MTKVAAYLRLSREDGDKIESDSITNQRSLIQDYLGNKSDMILVDEFVDDGVSGTTFERPAFTKMIEAAKRKQFDCIIVKDLSRFGRNYIETGRYLERTFPMLGVRFIAILDNYDSSKNDESGQLLIAFKNIFNDAYCRDISMKIRSSLDNKRKNGEFIGSFAAFGYKKDEEDHNHLVVDEYAGEIVQHIFRMKIAGCNVRRIAQKLTEMGVPTPLEYKRMCGEKYNSGFRAKLNPQWSVTSVMRILKNEIYTGTMIQNKRKKINYKIKESRDVDEADWIKVEGTHEAIIPKDIFSAVQELFKMDTRTSPNENTLYLFSGMVKCCDCGENMVRTNSYRNSKGEMMYCYHCSSYMHEKSCTPHTIQEKLLEPIVLTAIQNQLSVLTEAERIIQQVRRQPENSISIRLYDRQISEADAEERKYLDLKVRLYADMRDGIIEREEYIDMSGRFSEKAETARKRRDKLIEIKEAALAENESGVSWMKNFKSSKGIEKLDRNIVVTLIDKIIVHGKKEIEIIFRHGDEMAEYIAFAEECRQRMEEKCAEIYRGNRMEEVV